LESKWLAKEEKCPKVGRILARIRAVSVLMGWYLIR